MEEGNVTEQLTWAEIMWQDNLQCARQTGMFTTTQIKVQMIMRWLHSQKHLWVFSWGQLMGGANIYTYKLTGNKAKCGIL